MGYKDLESASGLLPAMVVCAVFLGVELIARNTESNGTDVDGVPND